MRKLTSPLFAIAAAFLVLAPLSSIGQNIVETSEKSPQMESKIQSLLAIGTSASHPDTALGNKQALIGAEVRKLVKLTGVEVSAIGIKLGEADVAKIVAEGVSKYAPSHTMSVTVPSGVVAVKRSTGESTSASSYVIKTEVRDVRSGSIVWNHTAQVEAGFFLGASNAEVATAIVARMRSDGLL
jgi:hypothetical protein